MKTENNDDNSQSPNVGEFVNSKMQMNGINATIMSITCN